MMRFTMAGTMSAAPRTGAKKRIWELDFIRGLLLLLVTWDHVCVFGTFGIIVPSTAAGVAMLNVFSAYTSLPARKIIQPMVIFAIAFLSGVNGSFSRNHAKRALQISIFTGAYMLVHFIGTLVLPSFLFGPTIFNILAVLSICTIVWMLIEKLRIPNWVIVAFSTTMLLVSAYYFIYYIRFGYYVLPDKFSFISLLFYTEQGRALSPNNFEPLFPAMSFFLFGGVYGRMVYKTKKQSIFHIANPKIFSPVMWIGKKSLWIYLLGPVVVLGILFVLNRCGVL